MIDHVMIQNIIKKNIQNQVIIIIKEQIVHLVIEMILLDIIKEK